MPSRNAPTATQVEESYSMPGLQFNETLSWRAGKPIAVAELLRRLQALSKEMQNMNQEEDARDSFTKVAKELVNANLLAHKDKGVRALTASCLVDILRLCAPDAPYTGVQLRVRSCDQRMSSQLANLATGYLQRDHHTDTAGIG